ncbi:MAG: hypothetical protein ACPGVT_14360, partial [Maricaulaceae bacterium]
MIPDAKFNEKRSSFECLTVILLLFLALFQTSCIAEVEGTRKHYMRDIEFTLPLSVTPTTYEKQFILLHNGPYDVGYLFRPLNPSDFLKEDGSYDRGIPKSLTAKIEILNEGKDVLLSSKIPLHSWSRANGTNVLALNASEVGKNEILILRIKNLHLASEDATFESEIN